MITEDYVSFETAKLLKEKGFDGQCATKYDSNGCIWDNIRYDGMFLGNNDIFPQEYLAPTLQMAMKWLRERHNIHPNIVVEVYGPYALYEIDRIFDGDEEKWVDFKDDDNISSLYNKFEEACEAAIKYCLENLI